MDKWEYLVITYTNTDLCELQEKLNIFGKNGWELVTFNIIIKDSINEEWYNCIFKRKI